MPYISTKTSAIISKEKEEMLKTKFGKAIEILPGKTESWLMLSFEDSCRLYFKGTSGADIAFVQVMLLGRAAKDSYEKLTAEITKILVDELDLDPAKIYVKYEEVEHWGWNGGNF